MAAHVRHQDVPVSGLRQRRTQLSRRYAVYMIPPHGSPLEEFGRRWLGRTPSAVPDTMPSHPALRDSFCGHKTENLIAGTRRRGFHATIRAPFEAAPRITPAQLSAALEEFCTTQPPVCGPPLRLACLGAQVALVPERPCKAISRLADACLRFFEPLRAPLSPADMERHRMKPLTERQERLLMRFGYPFVLEDYRFYMALTGRIRDPACRRALCEKLAPLVAPFLPGALHIGELCLFRQENRVSPFILQKRIPLTGRQSPARRYRARL